MTILLSVIALLVGAIAGWVVASARKSGQIQRALAERDLARTERERSEAAVAEARRFAATESQARVVAETQASFLGDARKQMEEAFAATAQKALASISTSFLELNKAHLDGSKGEIVASLDTKKAEIDTMLQPLRDMLDRYRRRSAEERALAQRGLRRVAGADPDSADRAGDGSARSVAPRQCAGFAGRARIVGREFAAPLHRAGGHERAVRLRRAGDVRER